MGVNGLVLVSAWEGARHPDHAAFRAGLLRLLRIGQRLARAGARGGVRSSAVAAASGLGRLGGCADRRRSLPWVFLLVGGYARLDEPRLLRRPGARGPVEPARRRCRGRGRGLDVEGSPNCRRRGRRPCGGGAGVRRLYRDQRAALRRIPDANRISDALDSNKTGTICLSFAG